MTPANELLPRLLLTRLSRDQFGSQRANRLWDALEGLSLPESSAHGDLHRENFVTIDGNLALVDWRNYRRRSSLIFDVIHYHMRAAAATERSSWVKLLRCQARSLATPRGLLAQHGFDFEPCLALYALNLTAMEIDASGGLAQLSSHRLRKYSYAIAAAARILL